MANNRYLKEWSEKVKLNFMILSKYILSLIDDIGIPFDIIRYINILYLECEYVEICKKMSPCTSLWCMWNFNEQSKNGKKTCKNFHHKKCHIIHCQEITCHNIICINRRQNLYEEEWVDSPREGFIRRKINGKFTGFETCKCQRIFCDICYAKRDQQYICMTNCLKIAIPDSNTPTLVAYKDNSYGWMQRNFQ
jgi:hypothetical protein